MTKIFSFLLCVFTLFVMFCLDCYFYEGCFDGSVSGTIVIIVASLSVMVCEILYYKNIFSGKSVCNFDKILFGIFGLPIITAAISYFIIGFIYLIVDAII